MQREIMELSVLVGAWNVNDKSPESIDLKGWICNTLEPPDILAIGFQELQWTNQDNGNQGVLIETQWKDRLKSALENYSYVEYVELKASRLDGIFLIIFLKSELQKNVKSVSTAVCSTMKPDKAGQKGGVGLSLEINETFICFVNCHLRHDVNHWETRNKNFHHIYDTMNFSEERETLTATKCIRDHDYTIMFGDLNYRINPLNGMSPDKSKELIKGGRWEEVLKDDQLAEQIREGNVFQGFSEGVIKFLPTYKYDPGTDIFDSTERNRPPAWCDRILYKTNDDSKRHKISQVNYASHHDYKLSDHKPISSLFKLIV